MCYLRNIGLHKLILFFIFGHFFSCIENGYYFFENFFHLTTDMNLAKRDRYQSLLGMLKNRILFTEIFINYEENVSIVEANQEVIKLHINSHLIDLATKLIFLSTNIVIKNEGGKNTEVNILSYMFYFLFTL